jgi:hypothetical protein
MTVEADLYTCLQGLVGGRVYPDVAPQPVAKPYITFQQVGGQAIAFLESAVVGKRNGRFQVNVWGVTRIEAAATMRAAEDALVVNTTLRAIPQAAPVSTYEPETGLYGARQDFSIWFVN